MTPHSVGGPDAKPLHAWRIRKGVPAAGKGGGPAQPARPSGLPKSWKSSKGLSAAKYLAAVWVQWSPVHCEESPAANSRDRRLGSAVSKQRVSRNCQPQGAPSSTAHSAVWLQKIVGCRLSIQDPLPTLQILIGRGYSRRHGHWGCRDGDVTLPVVCAFLHAKYRKGAFRRLSVACARGEGRRRVGAGVGTSAQACPRSFRRWLCRAEATFGRRPAGRRC